MRKNILSKSVLLILVALAFACKPKKILVISPIVNEEVVPVEANKKAENLNLIKSKDLVFNTLSLRAKAKLNINGDENNVTLLIRMQKDEKLWFSVTAIAGIEVARVLITPDSLWLRNNLEKTYIHKPFSYVHRFANNQVNFDLLQAMLSGNTIPGLTTTDSELNMENGVWVLSGQNEGLTYRSLFNTLMKVVETTLNDSKSAKALKVAYKDFTPLNSTNFPSSLKINSMSGAKRISVDLDFNKIEADVPLSFPFSVPKNFELIN